MIQIVFSKLDTYYINLNLVKHCEMTRQIQTRPEGLRGHPQASAQRQRRQA